jgi:hypothetical protein
MGLAIELRSLASRVIRKEISDDIGVRKIGSLDSVQNAGTIQGSGKGGILGQLYRTAIGLVGCGFKNISGFGWWLAGVALGGISFSLTSLWSLLVTGSIALYHFNWNATDEDIDATIKSRWISFASLAGGTLGESLGFFTCGVLPAVTTFAFNEAAGAYLLKRVGPEFLEELAGNMSLVLSASARSAAATYFALQYKNIRKILKSKSSPLRSLLPAKVIDNWGKKGTASYTFAGDVEKRIESIKNPFLRSFTESFVEEFFEGCVEGGYILAAAGDSWLWEQKNKAVEIKAEIVEITPNREAPNEKIILAGNRSTLRPAITSALVQHQLLRNRDVGQIVASDSADVFRRKPSDIYLSLIYYDRKEPPYNHAKSKRVTVNLTAVKRTKLDWKDIKRIAGKTGHQTGRFLANGKQENGSKISIYGATSEIASDMAKQLSEFSSAAIQVINITEETKELNRTKSKALQKEIMHVYPAYATITVNRINAVDGRATNEGIKRKKETYKFPIWPNEEPANFSEEFNALFSSSN